MGNNSWLTRPESGEIKLFRVRRRSGHCQDGGAGFDGVGGAGADRCPPYLDRLDRTDVGAPGLRGDRTPQVAAARAVEVADVRVERRVDGLERRVEGDREIRADRGRDELDRHRRLLGPVEVEFELTEPSGV